MSKRKTKEAQKVQQYKIGDTLQIKGMDYRVVEVLPDGYHVKNISSPFNSFIHIQGQPTSSEGEIAEDIEQEVKNEPDLIYRPDDRISL